MIFQKFSLHWQLELTYPAEVTNIFLKEIFFFRTVDIVQVNDFPGTFAKPRGMKIWYREKKYRPVEATAIKQLSSDLIADTIRLTLFFSLLVLRTGQKPEKRALFWLSNRWSAVLQMERRNDIIGTVDVTGPASWTSIYLFRIFSVAF